MENIDNILFRRNLPHIYPVGAVFFITFRLHDSLPIAVMEDLIAQKETAILKIAQTSIPDEAKEEALYNLEKRYFSVYDSLLDKYATPEDYLLNPAIAEIVANKIKAYNGQYYDLISYCIMPNHVHILIDTSNYAGLLPTHTLSNTMQLIKGGSAYLCNKALHRKGDFWQKESYDHYVRNGKEHQNIVRYILLNPVKANLVNNWEDWAFTYTL